MYRRLLQNREDSLKRCRSVLLPDYLQRLKSLQEKNRLLIADPYPRILACCQKA